MIVGPSIPIPIASRMPGTPARAISCPVMTCSIGPRACPPNSRGQVTPARPPSASLPCQARRAATTSSGSVSAPGPPSTGASCLCSSSQARTFARYSAGELNELELREAYPIVILLEGLAVRTAPEHAPAKIARLREINSLMASHADDPMAAVTRDFEFHEVLYGDCDNEQLLNTLRP